MQVLQHWELEHESSYVNLLRIRSELWRVISRHVSVSTLCSTAVKETYSHVLCKPSCLIKFSYWSKLTDTTCRQWNCSVSVLCNSIWWVLNLLTCSDIPCLSCKFLHQVTNHNIWSPKSYLFFLHRTATHTVKVLYACRKQLSICICPRNLSPLLPIAGGFCLLRRWGRMVPDHSTRICITCWRENMRKSRKIMRTKDVLSRDRI